MVLVTPAAQPAWLRNASIDSLGGDREKQNADSVLVYNPKTDISAQHISSLIDYVVAAARVMPFARLTIAFDDSEHSATVTEYQSMPGNGASFAPACNWISDGYCSLDWDASYQDSYDVEGEVNVTQALGGPSDLTSNIVSCLVADPTRVYVRAFTHSGGTPTDAVVTVEVA